MSRDPRNHDSGEANLDRLLTMADAPPQLDPEARARLLGRLQRSVTDLKKAPPTAPGGPLPMSPRNRTTLAKLTVYALSLAACSQPHHWPQSHLGHHLPALGIGGHHAAGLVFVGLDVPARACCQVQKPQHVAAGQGRHKGLLRVDGRRVGPGQGHDMRRRRGRHAHPAIKLPMVAPAVAPLPEAAVIQLPAHAGGVLGHGVSVSLGLVK